MNSATSTMHSMAAQSRKRWPLLVGTLGIAGLIAGAAYVALQPAADEGEEETEVVTQAAAPAVIEAKSPEVAAAAKALSAVEISFTFVPPVNPSPPLGKAFTPPTVTEQTEPSFGGAVMDPPAHSDSPVLDGGEAVAPEAVVPEAVLPETVSPEVVPSEAVAPEELAPEAIVPESAPVEDSLSAQAIIAESKALPRKESKADADRLYGEGQKLFAARDYQGAAAKFKEALLFREKQLAARLSLGVSLLRLGKAEAALEHFKIAEAQNREYPPTIYNFASYYATVGDTEQAVRELKRAFALYPKLKSWPATDPDFDRIREEPAFKALFQK